MTDTYITPTGTRSDEGENLQLKKVLDVEMAGESDVGAVTECGQTYRLEGGQTALLFSRQDLYR